MRRVTTSCGKLQNLHTVASKRGGALLLLALVSASFVCDLTEDTAEKVIKEVYWPLIQKSDATYMADDAGVPLVDYGYLNGVYIGVQRNPVTVERKALEYYETYEKGRQLFLNCADWLVSNAVEHGNFAALEYEFPWSYGNMTPPWRSGMAQGMALQVLTRAYDLTRDEKYLDSAQQMLASFYVDVEEGGVTRKTESDGWWYEEYADEGSVETKVLNGMLFAVLGIHEYYQYTGDENAHYLFDQGIKALETELPHYDRNGYSYYDALGHLSKDYHEIHVQLLERLYEITGEEVFKQYHDRWERYGKLPYVVQLVLNPTRMRILFYVGTSLVLFIVYGAVLHVIEKKRKKNATTLSI